MNRGSVICGVSVNDLTYVQTGNPEEKWEWGTKKVTKIVIK